MIALLLEKEFVMISISLKELFVNGYVYLAHGGKIEHGKEGSIDFYDLYQDGPAQNLLLCDGETVIVIQELPEFIVVENPENNCKIWFTSKEYEIATFR